MREVILDTETTGLSPSDDRIVEIGCVEMVGGRSTGRTFQRYINPERSMPSSAFLVHGISDEMLDGKPVFADAVDEFLSFVGDARLVIHNAPFDLGILNAELRRCKREQFALDRATDTLVLARKRYGRAMTLDALCRKLGVSLDSRRQGHGALIDAELLAKVYVELRGGRQASLSVDVADKPTALPGLSPAEWTPRLVYPTEAEAAAHAAFVASIPNAIWGTV